MKNRVKGASLVIGMCVLWLVTGALAEDFSADMIQTAAGGVVKGKIFVGNNNVRMETLDGVTISRMDKRVVWVFMPQDRMYMEQPFDPAKMLATSEKIEGETERTLMGQETIDGKMASKYQVVYNENGKSTTLFQWFVDGVKMPVKTAAADNSWSMEYKNIQTGAQPASLFEVPADYEKFSAQLPSMDDMLKGLVE